MKTPRSTKNAERGAAEQGKREFTGNSPLALVATIQNAVLRLWCATPSSWCRATVRAGAEHTANSVPCPHDSGALPCPEFAFSGWVSHVRKAWGVSICTCSTTQPTRYSLNTGPSGFLPQIGAETMTASPVASRSAAPTTTPTTGKTPTHFDPVATHFEAVNACAMARWYAARYEHTKAARKAAQGLSALRKLQAFEATSASPCTNCPDNRPLPSGPLDFFDAPVVAFAVERRAACTLCPAADKPCLKGGAA